MSDKPSHAALCATVLRAQISSRRSSLPKEQPPLWAAVSGVSGSSAERCESEMRSDEFISCIYTAATTLPCAGSGPPAAWYFFLNWTGKIWCLAQDGAIYAFLYTHRTHEPTVSVSYFRLLNWCFVSTGEWLQSKKSCHTNTNIQTQRQKPTPSPEP